MTLETLLTGDRPQPVRQFAGPQRGQVTRVTGTGELFVILDALGRDVEFGPCRYDRPPDALPEPETACLVLFSDAGAADPWVVAFDGWPTP